jgi:hypothetical protein
MAVYEFSPYKLSLKKAKIIRKTLKIWEIFFDIFYSIYFPIEQCLVSSFVFEDAFKNNFVWL